MQSIPPSYLSKTHHNNPTIYVLVFGVFPSGFPPVTYTLPLLPIRPTCSTNIILLELTMQFSRSVVQLADGFGLFQTDFMNHSSLFFF
jgi:hypothetical protein